MVRKRSKPVAPTQERYVVGDHFGLAGLDLENDDPVPVDRWIAEMRLTLETRWKHVEHLKRTGKLRSGLGRVMGERISAHEAEIWYSDAREDHRWRIRLLNPKTKEGKLYRGLMNYQIHGRLHMAISQLPEVIETIAYLLDLQPDFPAEPTTVPALRYHRTFPGLGIVSPIAVARKKAPSRINGVEIPRRYTKARARRAISMLFERRDQEYWNRIATPVVAIIDDAMRYWNTRPKAAFSAAYGGPGSVDLAFAIQDARGELAVARRTRQRDASINLVQVEKARGLMKKWGPIVTRYLRTRSRSGDVSQKLEERIRRAQLKHSRPRDILLQMIIDELDLGIGVVGLRRLIKKSSEGD